MSPKVESAVEEMLVWLTGALSSLVPALAVAGSLYFIRPNTTGLEALAAFLVVEVIGTPFGYLWWKKMSLNPLQKS